MDKDKLQNLVRSIKIDSLKYTQKNIFIEVKEEIKEEEVKIPPELIEKLLKLIEKEIDEDNIVSDRIKNKNHGLKFDTFKMINNIDIKILNI